MKFTMLSTLKVAANLHLYGGKTYSSSDLPKGVKAEQIIKDGFAVAGSSLPVNVVLGDVTDLPPQNPSGQQEEESTDEGGESSDEDESGEEGSEDEDESSDDEEEKDEEEEETPKRPKRRRRR